jgi:glycosyltransferase involved in cell wall biosynthesis
MCKVSVIVPNYNHARFLRQRLDSIFNQTYQDFEVILLDDASIDDSLEILAEYAKNQKVSHFIVNEKNSGSPFIQWKRGIGLAKGEYIWIAESDDWAEISFLEELAPEFSDQSIGLVFCASHWRGARGSLVTDRTMHQHSFMKSGRSEIKERLLFSNTIQNVSAVVFRSSVFASIELDQLAEYKVCGDWLIYASILKDWNFSFVNKQLNNFRRHESSLSLVEEQRIIQEGHNVLHYSHMKNYLNFTEYRKAVQSWLFRTSKLPYAQRKQAMYNIIGSTHYWAQLYFIGFSIYVLSKSKS